MRAETENFETLELIELVYEMVERGTKVPISGKIMIDKKEILDKLHEIINMYPSEIRRAQMVLRQREDMMKEADIRLSNAKRESIDIIENQVKNHDIVREAKERAQIIKAQAAEESRQIRLYAREYANDMLLDLENHIENLTKQVLDVMKDDMEMFAKKLTEDMKDKVEVLKENAKELEAPLP
ncbi:MAG: hypothetical protein ACRC57_04310 [Sarcina sp.]